jgi:putative MATE family efflux protein
MAADPGGRVNTDTKTTRASAASPRTRALLEGPISPTLAKLALPNMLVAITQSAVAVADAWFVGHIGVTALASLALVFPVQSMMQMMSTGAMGGGISSAVARALGSGDTARAERITLHALIIAVGMACLFTILFAVFARPLFALLGGREAALDGAVAYARILFGGAFIIWGANTLASLLRGSGNTALPGVVFSIMAFVNIGLSGTLTLGWFGAPKLGVTGPAVASLLSFSLAAVAMFAYLASGRGGVRLRLTGVALDKRLFMDILRVGAVACGNTVLTISTILIATALVARYGTAALAGYGLGSRLELLLVPITFGVGGAMTAMVGTNRGAGQHDRARRIAWTGGLTVFAIVGLIGLVVALRPDLWIGLFTTSDDAAKVARQYFRIAGPCFAFFGLGQSLYFATQGTGNMTAPFLAGVARLLVAGGGGTVVAIGLGAPLTWVFATVAAGLVVFGCLMALSLLRGENWHPAGPQPLG